MKPGRKSKNNKSKKVKKGNIKKCYGLKKGKIVNVYKHYVQNKKTKKNRCVITTTKRYNKNKNYTGRVFRLKKTANKQLKINNRKSKKRIKKPQRGGNINVRPYNSDPAMPHPESTNLNSNIPENYKTSNLMLEGQKGGSAMQDIGGLSDVQIGYYNLGNAFKNVGEVWNGGELHTSADPLVQPEMNKIPTLYDRVQNISEITTNASQNTIQ